ncbi:MAG TPA: alpha/beta-type small acid-soluble spore protein [Firmicutes bacterium]|nr:alpha/beta-type small acid-soluble spore protein [Bacillota bacterium]HHY99099.1 alpha/beta-type small acid-soluble spore protein [Bacillota bacterium]
MPRRNRSLLPQAGAALDKLKYEIANELNIPTNLIQGHYWGNLSSAQCGAVGGHMVRRMIEAAERALVEGTVASVQAGFQSGLAQRPGTVQTVQGTQANLSGIKAQ